MVLHPARHRYHGIRSVGSVASSYFLKPALNHIVAGDFKGLFWMLVAMGGVFLVSAGCSYAYSRIMVRISQRTVATLRQDLFNKLQTLPLRYFDTHQSGDLMRRLTNDMDCFTSALLRMNRYINFFGTQHICVTKN